MSKYLIIGIGQSYVLITGNIDLSIGSVVGMSAMIAATLMTMGVNLSLIHIYPGRDRGQRQGNRTEGSAEDLREVLPHGCFAQFRPGRQWHRIIHC